MILYVGWELLFQIFCVPFIICWKQYRRAVDNSNEAQRTKRNIALMDNLVNKILEIKEEEESQQQQQLWRLFSEKEMRL